MHVLHEGVAKCAHALVLTYVRTYVRTFPASKSSRGRHGIVWPIIWIMRTHKQGRSQEE